MPRRTFAPLIVAAILASSAARADDARSIDAAKKSFDAGMEQYNKGDFEGARIAFAQSFAAWPSVETLRDLAVAELKTDHCLDALGHLRSYAKDKNADPDFVKTKLPGLVERCNRQVGHLHVIAAPEAVVTVDGQRVVDPADAVDVAPGTHAVVATTGDHRDARSIAVVASQTADVDLRPASGAAPPPLPVTPPGGDGSPRSTEGFWTARNAWAVGLGGAAVVAAGFGTGFGVAASSERSSADSMTSGKSSGFCAAQPSAATCGDVRSTTASQRRDAIASDVAFAFAGAFAVSAVVVWAVWSPKDAPPRAGRLWIVPYAGAEGAAVLTGGSF